MPFKIQDSQLRQRVLHYVVRKKKEKTDNFIASVACVVLNCSQTYKKSAC